MGRDSLARLAGQVAECRRCPRLVAYREAVAAEKRRAFADWTYWGRPVPGFGDPFASVLIVGLAPAAHGANRTGRMFTGDRSGDWLYGTLVRFGLANQATSTDVADGLQLHDAYVSAAARCAPPDNKPTADELANCRDFLVREMTLLPARVVVTLGKIAFDSFLAARASAGHAPFKPMPKFGHLREYDLGHVTLIGSYHPSQRNTQTGFLTQSMFDAVFARAQEIIHGS